MATPAGMPPREAADEASPQPGQLPSALRDERAKVIYTNQFGTPCNRFLLVYDDLLDKGMGWLARYWSLALIAGVQAGRVLHEVAPPAGPTHWCAVPPFTLECYMARWNDCEVQSMPTASGIPTLHRRASQGTWGVEGLTRSKYLNRTALHMPLSAFAPVRWPSVHRPRQSSWSANETFSKLQHDATRFLFRPRTWVRECADCILSSDPLPGGEAIATGVPPFAAVFIRDSLEKRQELHAHGHGLPSTEQFASIALSLAAFLPPPHLVVLQTSSAAAFETFGTFARYHRTRMRVVASDNSRSDRDTWLSAATQRGKPNGMSTNSVNSTDAGMSVNKSMPDEGAIAAINLYIASRAEFFVSLSSSAWTYLVAPLMDGTRGDARGAATPVLYLCCRCGPQDHYTWGAHHFAPRSPAAPGTTSQEPALKPGLALETDSGSAPDTLHARNPPQNATLGAIPAALLRTNVMVLHAIAAYEPYMWLALDLLNVSRGNSERCELVSMTT